MFTYNCCFPGSMGRTYLVHTTDITPLHKSPYKAVTEAGFMIDSFMACSGSIMLTIAL